MTDHKDVNVHLEEDGYCYPDNKKKGKTASILFTDVGLIVTQGTESGRQARGISGALANKIVDSIVNKNAGDALYAMPYSEIESVAPAKSIMTGSGILVTLKNGEKFKFSSAKFALGGMKTHYPEIQKLVQQIEPSIRFASL